MLVQRRLFWILSSDFRLVALYLKKLVPDPKIRHEPSFNGES